MKRNNVCYSYSDSQCPPAPEQNASCLPLIHISDNVWYRLFTLELFCTMFLTPQQCAMRDSVYNITLYHHSVFSWKEIHVRSVNNITRDHWVHTKARWFFQVFIWKLYASSRANNLLHVGTNLEWQTRPVEWW